MSKESAASNISYIGNASIGAAGLLTFNEWMMLGGLIFSALTFAVNFYFQYQRNKILKCNTEKDTENN